MSESIKEQTCAHEFSKRLLEVRKNYALSLPEGCSLSPCSPTHHGHGPFETYDDGSTRYFLRAQKAPLGQNSAPQLAGLSESELLQDPELKLQKRAQFIAESFAGELKKQGIDHDREGLQFWVEGVTHESLWQKGIHALDEVKDQMVGLFLPVAIKPEHLIEIAQIIKQAKAS